MPDVRKVIETVQTEYYTLKLSKDEAEAVGVALAKIGGNEDVGVRGLTQPVLDSLEAAGVDWYESPMRHGLDGRLISLD